MAAGGSESRPDQQASGPLLRRDGRRVVANEREPVSKRTRFNVFKRDGFQCQYCGQTPPAIVLEIDHILAVANGGKSGIDNLLTACFDCNRGKGAENLTICPQTIQEKALLLAEKQEQLKAFEKLKKAVRKWEESKIDEIEAAFQEHFPDRYFAQNFRTSVRVFIQKLDSDRVVDAMHRACVRMRGDEKNSIKYFCGICWKTIKEPAGKHL